MSMTDSTRDGSALDKLIWEHRGKMAESVAEKMQERAERAEARAASAQGNADRQAEIARQFEIEAAQSKARAAAAQAKIDALMLEFCPNEMTPEQIACWEQNQVIAQKEGTKHD